MKKPTEERFWAKVQKTDSCWLWTGITNHGYGQFYDGKSVRSHRYSYVLHKGDIAEGLVLDHLCRVKNCVNPDHLEAVTQLENVHRGLRRSNMLGQIYSPVTHCVKGHEYTPENTYYVMKKGKDTRRCRACNNIHNQLKRKKWRLLTGLKHGGQHYYSVRNVCKHGHPYTDENTYIQGKRRCCRTCNRDRQAKFNQKHKNDKRRNIKRMVESKVH